ncbi:NUDIX hydrolase [Alteromonas sp. H39]|uniref:NUDIX hydrolase n=1 Tax=Alteromonas sp. H39 TaxID=3389876 RepID=UPI0039E1FDCE
MIDVFRLSVIFAVLTIMGCSSDAPAPPMCRTASDYSGNEENAACLIRAGDKLLLIRHRLSGKLDMPGGGKQDGESLACAAHRETWEETGVNVLVGEPLGRTPNGMLLFACHEQANVGALPDTFNPPDWADLEVISLHQVNPFELDHDDLRFASDLIPLRDGFVAMGQPPTASPPSAEQSETKAL